MTAYQITDRRSPLGRCVCGGRVLKVYKGLVSGFHPASPYRVYEIRASCENEHVIDWREEVTEFAKETR